MKKRILVVDDEPDINLILKIILEENSFEVDTYDKPLLALENFRKGTVYDLIILDIKMPNMNGFELYREIKKIDDKVNVCFLTAGEKIYHGSSDYIFIDQNQFIRKPIENQDLLNYINSITSKT